LPQTKPKHSRQFPTAFKKSAQHGGNKIAGG
jgi:hypothetical protein